MRRLRHLILLLFVPLVGGCDLLEPSLHRTTFYVASYTRECVGMVVQQCMLVREDPAGEWLNFYSDIEGFTYEPGYEYVLRVGWREIRNPPADGSSREYWLIRLVEKTRAPGVDV